MPPERRRRPLFLVALAALFVTAGGSGFYASWRSLRSAALVRPAPRAPAAPIRREDFYVVAFPVPAVAALRPPVAGEAPVPLRRAVLLSLGDLDAAADGTVSVWERGREHAVEVRSLTFVPPANAAELTDALNAAVGSRGAEADLRRVRVERRDAMAEGVNVRLVMTDNSGRDEAFDYAVRGDAVVPVARGGLEP